MACSIALGSIFIECNHFGGATADLDVFRRTELYYGKDVLHRDAGTVGGMQEVLRGRQVEICVASHPTYEWCGEQYELRGLEARDAKFVVVKNPMNYRMAYGAFSKAGFLLNTPGPTPPTLRGIEFHNVRRPYFPADAEIPGIRPSVVSSTRRDFNRLSTLS